MAFLQLYVTLLCQVSRCVHSKLESNQCWAASLLSMSGRSSKQDQTIAGQPAEQAKHQTPLEYWGKERPKLEPRAYCSSTPPGM
ncbi:hypothetical protein GGR53DRAFT_75861 [Hypoxylon sp. FL1150]|nr:hypothetical protein GGR53DRAFT_75861 [Hypoxylon sp. FL1150]